MRPRARLFALCLSVSLPLPATAQEFTTPGGLGVALLDIALEAEAVRMRFVAPELGAPGFDVAAVAEEMMWICETHIASAIADNDLGSTQVIVSIAREPIPLGEFDPDIPQIFDGFLVEDGTCTWGLYPPLAAGEVDEPETEGTD